MRASISPRRAKVSFATWLLKQPLIGVCPARCATAVMPALRPIGDRQTFGAYCDLTLDYAEMALRLGLHDFHAREQDASSLELDHRTVPVSHKGRADTSGT